MEALDLLPCSLNASQDQVSIFSSQYLSNQGYDSHETSLRMY